MKTVEDLLMQIQDIYSSASRCQGYIGNEEKLSVCSFTGP